MIKKVEGGYIVDVRPQGRKGRRFRKKLGSHAEALAYERYLLSEYATAEPWKHVVDKRRLSDLCDTWFELHGKQIKTGAKRMTEYRKACKELGDPIAKDFTAADFAKFRAKRLKKVTANTVNHDLINFRSLFNELKRLGEWPHPNPMEGIRRLKIDERELQYLDHGRIKALLAELDKSPKSHARIITRICLATGARWGEVATLKSAQVHNGQIHLTATKSGKNRSIPIAPDLEKLIVEHAPLIDGMNTFKRAVAELDFKLPTGQKTHILRHTFASHFMMNGGNIITLQRILGHGSLAMTVRYAHLSPDHLQDAVTLNPLANRHSIG